MSTISDIANIDPDGHADAQVGVQCAGLTIDRQERLQSMVAWEGRSWQRGAVAHSRRNILRFGLGSVALGAVALQPLSAAATAGPRTVALHNPHTGEALNAVYWDNGAYVPAALAAVNHVLRDYRNGEVHTIEPRLIDLLTTLAGRVEGVGPFEVISGYRSPATNAMLHAHSDGVAKGSLHMQGLAIDIRLPGVGLDRLHRAALSLAGGGVGYYPVSDFVHVDVGRVRQWGGA
jgi:uncharacterized protein YcbK (DUF882 family)